MLNTHRTDPQPPFGVIASRGENSKPTTNAPCTGCEASMTTSRGYQRLAEPMAGNPT
jgi:hypothetical protein